MASVFLTILLGCSKSTVEEEATSSTPVPSAPEVVKDLHAKLKKWNSLLPQDAGFPKPRKGPGPTSKLSNPVPGQPPGIPRLASSLQNLKTFSLLGP